MPIEIERKFIADKEKLPTAKKSTRLEQGYIDRSKATVRVRVSGDECFLTIKGAVSGKSRLEYEYAIPVEDARGMLRLCTGLPISKRRYTFVVAGKEWVVDEFSGANAGLIVAEIELEDESDAFEHPAWLREEVSHKPQYFNANLARHPYRSWSPGDG